MALAKSYYAVIASIVGVYCFTYTFSNLHHHSHASVDHSSMDHSSMGHDMPMMPMWFQFSLDTYLWLQGIHPTSPLAYCATLLLLVGFAIAHEALASHRVSYVKAVGSAAQQQGYVAVPAERNKDAASQLRSRAINSSLYAANMATSFLLMLAVMTYNAGYFAAVVIGLGLGHFFCFKQPWHFRVDTCCETAVGAAEF